MDNLLIALQRWYAACCDGEWEHRYGISIQSCDNPGWWVKIDLAGTGLESRPFSGIAQSVDAAGFQQSDRWLHCRIQDGIWNGSGDETKLGVILKVFLDWAEKVA